LIVIRTTDETQVDGLIRNCSTSVHPLQATRDAGVVPCIASQIDLLAVMEMELSVFREIVHSNQDDVM
jgi:hypothetical protein